MVLLAATTKSKGMYVGNFEEGDGRRIPIDFAKELGKCRFSKDGTKIYYVDGLRVLRVDTEILDAECGFRSCKGDDGDCVEDFALAPVRPELYTCSNKGMLNFWDLRCSSKYHTIRTDPLKTVGLLSSYDCVITGDTFGRIKLWCLRSGREIDERNIGVSPVTSLSVSPDDCFVCATSGMDTLVFSCNNRELSNEPVYQRTTDAVLQSMLIKDTLEDAHFVSIATPTGICTYSVEGGDLLWEIAADQDTTLTSFHKFLGDDRLFTGHEDGVVRDWDLHRPLKMLRPPVPLHLGPVMYMDSYVKPPPIDSE